MCKNETNNLKKNKTNCVLSEKTKIFKSLPTYNGENGAMSLKAF